MPTANDQSEFALQFWKHKNGPADNSKDSKVPTDPPGKVVVSLWMPAMGHGSLPPEISHDPTSRGTYHVQNVLFSMGGDWEIWVTLLADNQLIEKSKLVYRLE